MKFNKKSILKNSDLGITVIIIIGILVVVNFLSYQIFYRWDLTDNKDYSISKASKNTVENLDDIVNIKVYFSKNLPSQYITLEQEVGDILDEYANYANGKIKIEFIDPEKLDNPEQELYLLGIPALQFNVMEKDKYEVVKGYLGMVIQYGDKNETIPIVQNTDNLEYSLTMAIKKATSKDMAIIGFVTSNGCASLENEISQAYEKLQELYLVQEIDLETGDEIPAEINTLLIVGPKENFSEKQLKAIDSFLLKGGSIMALVDGVKIDEGLLASVNDTNLGGLFENYGIKLNNDLVLDVSSGMASFSSGFITFSTNYPFWPKVLKSGFDEGNAAVAELESIILPWASSLNILSDKFKESNKVSYLVKTTNKAWTQVDNFNLDPQQNFFSSGNTGQYDLAISVSGEFNSAYEQDKTGQARIILVGDSDFINDGFLRQAPDNLVFFQNLVDSLSLDEDLINIRSKGVSDRPLKELSDSQRAVFRYLNVFGLTAVVVLFGLFRYFKRKRKKFVDEL